MRAASTQGKVARWAVTLALTTGCLGAMAPAAEVGTFDRPRLDFSLPQDPPPPLPLLPVQVAPPPLETPVTWRDIDREDDVIERRATFPSALPSGSRRNDEVPLRLFLPREPKEPGKPLPVVIVLHYWGATDQRAEVALAKELTKRGVAAALIALPYHLERTPTGLRSGEAAIPTDIPTLKRTLLQGVADVRRALDVVHAQPEIAPGRSGVVGISLGAIVAALSKAVDPRLADAAFLLGGVDLAKILWTSSVVTRQRESFRRQGYTEARLRDELKDIEPMEYLRARPGDRSLVVWGRYDTVVTPAATQKLIQLLNAPSELVLDTGHYGGIFVQRRLSRIVADFFAAALAQTDYVAPKAIYAPTLRIGVKADYPTGIDVGAGIDLYRFDRRGDGFVSALLTPRGPAIFAGVRIWRQMHLGVTGSTRGAAVGVFWSVVL